MLAVARLDERDAGALDHADDRADEVGAAGQFAVDCIGEQQRLVGDDIDEPARFDEHAADHRIDVCGIAGVGEQTGARDAARPDQAADGQRAGIAKAEGAACRTGGSGGALRSGGAFGALRAGSAGRSGGADRADTVASRRFAGAER